MADIVLRRIQWGTWLEDHYPTVDAAVRQACIEVRDMEDPDSGISFAADYQVVEDGRVLLDHLAIVDRCYQK